jgi:hypothetical protein
MQGHRQIAGAVAEGHAQYFEPRIDVLFEDITSSNGRWCCHR